MTIEERVAALEAEVTDLRQKLTDTHTLAAHADRDVAEFRDELRHQTGLINLTRQDMGDLREELTGQVRELRGEMNSQLSGLRGGMSAIVGMLEQLGARRQDDDAD